ncbi:MAG: sigma-70 family RNA polymerase sigma factor [Phototrophicaceae bacterium]
MSDPIIVEWVQRALDGDQDAFAELVYAHQDAVYNLCYRMLGTTAEAEDATQEAFLRAYINLARYDTGRSFKTWVMSIASNHCIDRIRRRRMQLLSLDEPLSNDDQLALSSKDDLPETFALRRETESEIQALLDELQPDYRAAVVLRYWYDYSYTEIADALNTSESAIKSRLFRARQMLADRLSSQQQRQSNSPQLGDSLRGRNR